MTSRVMKTLSWREYVRLLLSYAVYTPNDNGSWTVEVAALPGCVTWGQTRAEAAQMIDDAVQGWLATALRFGDPIPVVDGCTLAHAADAQPDEVLFASTEPWETPRGRPEIAPFGIRRAVRRGQARYKTIPESATGPAAPSRR